jgi:hypothetical protein
MLEVIGFAESSSELNINGSTDLYWAVRPLNSRSTHGDKDVGCPAWTGDRRVADINAF